MTLLSACSPSQPDKPYKIIQEPLSDNKPSVVEYFAYFCPHCKDLEPRVNSWKKKLPKSVGFTRVPLTLGNSNSRLYSRAYFIGEALGVLDKSHDALFLRYHQLKQPIASEAQLKSFFLSIGVSEADYLQVANDEAVSEKIDQAEERAKQIGVVSVPSFVVNGRYLTDARMNGSEKALFEQINVLLRKK